MLERGINDPLVIKWAIRNEITEKRFKRALKLATKYFEQEPEDFDFAITVADGAARDGNPSLAVQIMEPFVRSHPTTRSIVTLLLSWQGIRRRRGV
jgi:beta-galactosidase/beta-glucuronidase